MIKKYI